ncbi:MAG TPA: FAD-linked oxidase C-terminal domain-containing protein [Acidimicrobiia bacterium]|nr:FAD-linked oxidase C-terminal domain-containing protein [Acidimicrobiia bacterium]
MGAEAGGVLGRLAGGLPAPAVVTDPDVMDRFVHDEAEWAPFGKPVAVVRPRTTAEVAEAVSACAATATPLVTRGAGTGLSGGANAVDGCVVLSTELMTGIRSVDPANQIAVVEPGVINDDLRRAVAAEGLWYPPDPASYQISTIGGNVATNAGGLCCLKYGVTRDYVLALEVVLASGTVVRLGSPTKKNSAGYDLRGLMVGSEGTLGVVTEVTVRLRPLPPGPPTTVVGFFDTLTAAGDAVAAVTASGVIPVALELLDRYCLRAVEEWKRMELDLDAAVLLLARLDTPGAVGEAEAATVLRCFEAAGASEALRSDDEETAEALFAARRLAYPALERLGPVLTEDVCVPRTRVTAMLEAIEAAGARRGVTIANIAHAGDGNLHPLFVVPAGDDDARRRAQLAFDDIIAAAIALGGTVSGEHGIGLLKRAGLADQVGPDVLALYGAVKRALDPAGILNPGKII